MLIGAAAAHEMASIPLLVIGGVWFLTGLAGIRQSRRQASEIILDGGSVEFRSAIRSLTIPAEDIIEISRSRFDFNHMGALRFKTRSNGVIKAAPRLQGIFDFLVELRRINPEMKVGNL